MKIPDGFNTYMVWLIDEDGCVVSNIFCVAPSISWVMNFFKGTLLTNITAIVEDANNVTFDSSKWKEDPNAKP